MATVIPPPSKRQKRENLEKTQIQQDVTAVAAGPAGSFKARFLDSDGKQMADVIEVPLADASEKNLSLLLNTLLARVCLHHLIGHTNGAHWLTGDENRKGKNSSHIASEYTSRRQTLSLTNTRPTYSNFYAAMALRIHLKPRLRLVPNRRLFSKSKQSRGCLIEYLGMEKQSWLLSSVLPLAGYWQRALEIKLPGYGTRQPALPSTPCLVMRTGFCVSLGPPMVCVWPLEAWTSLYDFGILQQGNLLPAPEL